MVIRKLEALTDMRWLLFTCNANDETTQGEGRINHARCYVEYKDPAIIKNKMEEKAFVLLEGKRP